MRTITLIPGDGIGVEVTNSVKRVVEATNVEIYWEIIDAGEKAFGATGEYMPQKLIDSIYKNKIAFKGPLTTPIGEGFRSINVALRKEFNTYANIRPVKNMPNIKTPFNNVDLVIIRENSEGLYTGIEHVVTHGVTEAIKVITRDASLKIAKHAFEYARFHNRKKVTAVHKANIMKITDGLFLESVREIASDYDDIEYEEIIVDNMAMQLVMYPEKYDVLVMPNLYGDIISDLAAGLVGGLGLIPSGNIGDDIAIFEAVHGSAPLIAGKNMANPIACILSSAMMLDYMNEKPAGDLIRKAVFTVLKEGKCLTNDIGGNASTDEITDAICNAIKKYI
ncbi:MAG: isocitrate/isopropylmalate dehydrogenase family protein [Clostridiales bacterium]|nr:isocitrate/isopropylmalate dehydrogenase family protein [Clostridiales bacterium]